MMWDEVNLSKNLFGDGEMEKVLSPGYMEDPISPLSSTGNGSPYYGTMSPDTTSSGSPLSGMTFWGSEESDCFSPESFSPKSFYDAGVASPSCSSWSSSPSVTSPGALPSFFEFRKLDFQKIYLEQQQQFVQNQFPNIRFIFPEVASGNIGQNSQDVTAGATCEPIVTSSTAVAPVKTDKPKSLSASKVGQRAAKFMKSFKTSAAPLTTKASCKSPGINVVSSTCLADEPKSFNCHWIDCKASYLTKVT